MQTNRRNNFRERKFIRRSEDRDLNNIFSQNSELFHVGQIIASEIDYDILFDVIIKETNRIMGVERCSIFLLDEKGEMLNAFASAGVGGLAIRLPKSRGIAGWVFNNHEPLIINNVYEDTRFYHEIDKKSGLHTNNILCVPLMTKKNKCIGALEIVNKKSGEFTNSDREVLTHLSDYVAIALENARAYRELKMIDRAKERVINHLAHELKTPISLLSGVIRNLSKTLRKYDSTKGDKYEEMGRRNIRKLFDLQEKVNDILEYRPVKEKDVILNLVKQAAGIVSDLMDEEGNDKLILRRIYDRIESIYRVEETKFEKIYLKGFIEDFFSNVISQSHRKTFAIQKDVDENISLYTDSNVLKKILFGLIKNAIENTPDEGKIEIRAYMENDEVVIDCTDHGVGITRENQEQIFFGFFHTQNTHMYSTKKPFDFNAGGAGIDLLRTKILCERFGYIIDFVSKRCEFIMLESDQCAGKISICPHIRDKEGCYNSGGSTFSIRFPVHAPNQNEIG
ncbi:MAG TPA: GAF domain-containing protein [Desulfobacteraceae bacterium]|nr:GAF domain-containing protein [Desulfobacteraceae bacterium]HPJ66975.1 GAF domain-containing protein [Desulfobacteraceae bacterium]HPQ27126.1 GAF domain-containing protein [Desulfobacteraceae bacterium]